MVDIHTGSNSGQTLLIEAIFDELLHSNKRQKFQRLFRRMMLFSIYMYSSLVILCEYVNDLMLVYPIYLFSLSQTEDDLMSSWTAARLIIKHANNLFYFIIQSIITLESDIEQPHFRVENTLSHHLTEHINRCSVFSLARPLNRPRGVGVRANIHRVPFCLWLLYVLIGHVHVHVQYMCEWYMNVHVLNWADEIGKPIATRPQRGNNLHMKKLTLEQTCF